MNEISLVKTALKGDTKAWDELYEKYHLALYNFIYSRVNKNKADSDDIFQETFMSTVKKLNSFDVNKGSFQNWIFSIALNLIRLKGRQLKRYQEVLVLVIDEKEEIDMGIHENLNPNEENSRLAFSLLCVKYQKVLSMKYIDGLSLQEMGQALSLTSEAVGSLLYRARQGFKTIYSQLVNQKGVA